MKKNKLLISLAIVACSNLAMADEEINYSFSLKDWNHNFKQSGSSTEHVNASVLSLTARKGEYFITASSLMPTTYSFGGGSELFRRDFDAAVGWSLNPNISLLAGQKKIGVRSYNTSDGWERYSLNFSYLGANGFTQIGEQSFMYGTVTRSFKSKDTSDNGTTMKLTNVEFGYGYVLSKSTQLTAGYRNQKFSDTGGTTTLAGAIFGVNITP